MAKDIPEKKLNVRDGDNEGTPVRKEGDGIVVRSITTEMREAYLNYAMSVITARALPDIRDGLKPVHRRILFAMHEIGLTASAKTRKSAKITGDVTGNYHPHGDAAVYESLVKMTQPFSMRYPLIIGQGNFGSIDGDNAAAPRYTEAKMSKISAELLRDLEKNTVDWRPNYEGTRKEPIVLPTSVPNLLLNGTLGIAVGMASNIPPHNLGEVLDATTHLIDNSEATTEDLLQFIKGPDFPTGAILYGQKDLAHAYATGRGGVVVRGEAEIIEDKKGQFSIIITSLPYRVIKSTLLERVAELVRDKLLDGVRGMRDESSKDIRIVIDLKNGAHPEKVLNFIYKHTQLEESFHFNVVALIGGVPKTLSLKTILEEFVAHRIIVVKRRTQFDLDKALDREHILIGLKKALDYIDRIITLIRGSKDALEAHVKLMKEFKFSERQATAILEMKLQKLAGLERKKVEEELNAIQLFIAELKDLLGSNKKILALIKKELSEIKAKYNDERRTKIMKNGVKEISDEDLIPDEESVLILTKGGYIKRTNPDEYKKQKRGGVGVVDLDTKDEDFVTIFVTASTHNDLLFFTDKGKAYKIKMFEVPEGKRATKGKSIMNFLPLGADEKINSILPIPKEVKGEKNEEHSIMMITKLGTGKKVSAKNFSDVRRSGLIAITLHDGDELVSATLVQKSDDMILVSADGQSIRFKESDIREMGRGAAGVRAMDLDKTDTVVHAEAIRPSSKGGSLFVISEKGFGKKTLLEEYKTQNRGGSGILTAKVTEKIGPIMSARVVTAEIEEVIAMSKKSQVIRTEIKEIPELGRQTQGVRIMKLRDGDSIASLICL
ncbi:MAG: DNA gyrase subunit A [Candidatus Taylorbacteria bacterium]|nr:DNA gyrase subunit A [Candidatus Taylorbacteria bacterium]